MFYLILRWMKIINSFKKFYIKYKNIIYVQVLSKKKNFLSILYNLDTLS